MKRSAAPSQMTGARKKSTKFMPPYLSNLHSKETEITLPKSESGSNILLPASQETEQSNVLVESVNDRTSSIIPQIVTKHHNVGIDEKIANNRKLTVEAKENIGGVTEKTGTDRKSVKKAFVSPASHHKELTTQRQPEPLKKKYFNVVWCKRSNKKIKNWEGDAILVVTGRSVVLYDTDGKEIGKANGYKIQELDQLKEGETLPVGTREIEIMSALEESAFLAGTCFGGNSSLSTLIPLTKTLSKALPKKNVTGSALFLSKTDASLANTVKELKPRFDPNTIGALVLSRPPPAIISKGMTSVDVVVDPHLCNHLRPHQREGVNFLYECVMGYKGLGGLGAILADEMGLGKTLQIIALLWTLLKQNPISHKPVARRALIVTPGSLVKNWCREFKKWLGQERLKVFDVSSDRKASEFKNAQVFPVMIVSYEMFVRYCDVIKQSEFDLLVCDEGHRLKNSSIKTTSLLHSLNTKRRIVVTGTPIQNDLKEFFALVDFCNPGVLGSAASFHKVYEDPILLSKQPSCTLEDKKVGEERARELNRVTASFILRRTSDINQQYLPEKTEYVVFCQPTSLQIAKYKQLIDSSRISCLSSNMSDVGSHLLCINDLKKVCNYPLFSDKTEDMPGAKISTVDPLLSGKLLVVAIMLKELQSSSSIGKQEKIILVSYYTKTLDIFEVLCTRQGYSYLRLDGQTPVQKRQQMVELFNSSYSQHMVFLLSSKAGGVGLNLIGANRLILYDIDWNPANDLQAMARIWREGQKKPVHIYRLLTAGTIEEKIYQRQVTKQGLGNSVVDSVQDGEVKFSQEDLKDLFTFRPDATCDTHDMLMCTCLENNTPSHSSTSPTEGYSAQQKLKNTSMSELNKWSHIEGQNIHQNVEDRLLRSASEKILFLFCSKVSGERKA